jgi:hypothetical protein
VTSISGWKYFSIVFSRECSFLIELLVLKPFEDLEVAAGVHVLELGEGVEAQRHRRDHYKGYRDPSYHLGGCKIRASANNLNEIKN